MSREIIPNLEQLQLEPDTSSPVDKAQSPETNYSTLKFKPIQHPKINAKEIIWTCSTCDKQFMSKFHLKMHNSVHTESLIECAECGRKFKQKCHVANHLRCHGFVKPPKIPKRLSKKQDFLAKRRSRLDFKEKRFECLMCGKKMKSKYHLQKHIEMHADKRSFDVVEWKRFLTKNLKEHSIDQENECFQCGKQYKILSHLKLHMRTHTKILTEKKGACDEHSVSEIYVNRILDMLNKEIEESKINYSYSVLNTCTDEESKKEHTCSSTHFGLDRREVLWALGLVQNNPKKSVEENNF